MTTFRQFFEKAFGNSMAPYPYQERLATEAWPDVLNIPTGLGKTAAITLAWAYRKRVADDPAMPRRLVWCMPMRVLAEQTRSNIESWFQRLGVLGSPGEGKVSVHLLMGGESELRAAHWAHHPEEDVVLVGTQDMLLSRALMRGYGMSRYQWPIHFALLHNDALWVFDEVQLMGAALYTSTQLEGLRRKVETALPTRSLWVSATLRPEWLGTVDFRDYGTHLSIATLSDDDRANPGVVKRLSASKRLIRAAVKLDAENRKEKAKRYIADLASEIASVQYPGSQTLVILNRVERAQALYRALKDKWLESDLLLLHARFRPQERAMIETRLRKAPTPAGRVIVATQAVEAGVDVSSRTLFTELAPWPSMVQRFGRCNRAGEHQEAEIRWIDIGDDADEADPYERDSLSEAREILSSLSSASLKDLPPIVGDSAAAHVLRRKDLYELFNTDPDLSGFDIDVSPYVRDRGTPQCQVFWRDFDDQPGDQDGPLRDELCPASLGQVRNYLHSSDRKAWTWDPLKEQWQMIDRSKLRPGMILLLRAHNGGYLPDEGFVPEAKKKVRIAYPSGEVNEDRYTDDPLSNMGCYVALAAHLEDVAREVEQIVTSLGMDETTINVLIEAAHWHDIGKAHPAFQGMLLSNAEDPDDRSQILWAKAPYRGPARCQYVDAEGKVVARPCFRHELASTLAWLEHNGTMPESDLVAYLIAAHHGKVRLGLRALPIENAPPEDDRLYARGVWDGDKLPAICLHGLEIPHTVLRLDLMQLGDGQQGPSWTARTQKLLRELGPFKLAWLETLLRIADWRASKREEQVSPEEAINE